MGRYMKLNFIFIIVNHLLGGCSLPRNLIYAVVVQLVEPQTSNLVVAGPSPVYRSNLQY